VLITRRQAGGVYTIHAALVTPLNDQILSFVVSLDAQPYPLPHRKGACQLMVVGLSQAVVCFFSLFFSLLTNKVYIYSLCFLFFNFSPHYFNFLFCYYSFYICFFVLQFSPSITLFHMFLFQSSFFLIFDFVFIPFIVSILILLISYFNPISFKEVLFFNLVLQLQFIILFCF